VDSGVSDADATPGTDTGSRDASDGVASDADAMPGTDTGGDSAPPVDGNADRHLAVDAGPRPDGRPDRSFPSRCTHHADCAGHPDGEVCVFFEQRCGQCLYGSDCPSGQTCVAGFVCRPLTDQMCAQMWLRSTSRAAASGSTGWSGRASCRRTSRRWPIADLPRRASDQDSISAQSELSKRTGRPST
jgi:hypothetical protein